MSVLEPPLERVNYFNGERLEARDYRAEQEYFLRVRRLLNRSLYSPGIVKGLEVTKHATDKHKVIVAPGLAFDAAGREVVVFEPQTVQVVGMPSTSAGTVLGNFLVISYSEQRGTPAGDACHPAGQACGCRLEWSGPTRIRSNVKLEMVDTWPSEASGRVVLAQVELKQGCEVAQVHSGVRKYAVAVKPPKTRAVAIEGEKDIDAANPKRLFFHVDGGYPDTVTLVLRGALFSTLYYTELGRHTHAATAEVSEVTRDFAHSHTVSGGKTTNAGKHRHRIQINDGEEAPSADVETENFAWSRPEIISEEGEHFHDVTEVTLSSSLNAWTHKHTVTVTNQNAGVTDVNARSGSSQKALTYVNNLRVWYDGADITAEILQQLQGRDPVSWPAGSTLGDGTQNHVFVKDGTKAINLSQVVDDVSPGEHRLEFKVAAGGGQVHYNLYVE